MRDIDIEAGGYVWCTESEPRATSNIYFSPMHSEFQISS